MNQASKAQTTLLKSYANGEFSHLLELPDEASIFNSLDGCGDTLLTFLFIELSVGEDCLDVETAVGRVERAMSDLSQVHQALIEEANAG